MTNEFILIAGMALVTFATRYPVIAVLSKIPLPDPVFRALRYVPPAVLTAIILPAVLLQDSEMTLTYLNPSLVASLAAVIISWRTKNLLLTIVLGMLVFWGWRAIIGIM